MKNFIAFVGINGAGKTTALIDLFEQVEGKSISEFVMYEKISIGHGSGFHTKGKYLQALGRYERGKTSGSDSIKISDAKIFFDGLDFEGTFLYDGVFGISQPVFDVYKRMANRGIKITIIYLLIPFGLAHQRILKRNGGNDIKMDMKKRKDSYDKLILKLSKTYPEFRFHILKVGSEDIKQRVLDIYKKLVDI